MFLLVLHRVSNVVVEAVNQSPEFYSEAAHVQQLLRRKYLVICLEVSLEHGLVPEAVFHRDCGLRIGDCLSDLEWSLVHFAAYLAVNHVILRLLRVQV